MKIPIKMTVLRSTFSPLVFLALTAVLASSHLHAEVYMTPVKSGASEHKSAALFVGSSDSEYDRDDSRFNFDADRSFLGGQFDLPISNSLVFNGHIAMIFDSDIDPGSSSGDGFTFGGGLSGEVFAKDRVHVNAYGFLNYITENYDNDNIDTDLRIMDLHLGSAASFAVNQEFFPFIGLELIPYCDGKIESGNAKDDIERDNRFHLRLGARYLVNGINLGLDIAMMNDSMFNISAAFLF